MQFSEQPRPPTQTSKRQKHQKICTNRRSNNQKLHQPIRPKIENARP